MNLRTAIVFSLAIATPLLAQVDDAATAPQPARKLSLITETVSQNFIPKYVDGAGTLGNSTIYESTTGWIGIGTTAPLFNVHLIDGADVSSTVEVQNTNNLGVNAAAAFRTRADAAVTSYVSHGSGRTSPTRFGNVVGGWSEILTFGGNGLMIGTNHAAPLILGTSGASRLHITPTGNVGIGISTPAAKLTLVSGLAGGTGINVTQWSTAASSPQTDTGSFVTVVQDVPSGNTNAGGVIGARGEAWKTNLGTATWATGGYFQTGTSGTQGGTVINAFGVQAQVLAINGTVTNGHGVYVGDVGATNDYAFYQIAANDTNYFAGNLVIGGPPTVSSPYALAVQGNANFVGTVTGTNIKAHYQDLAEWVPSTADLTPGTVVILNRDRDNEVMASSTAYDTTVAGVVSAQPGISLGVEGEGKEQIATTGRVKVRVDARSKAIRVGDLLVTSNTPGTAMRSEPMDVNGRPFHQPGTIIGKALQALDGGVGEILVLLSMQ